MNSDPGTFCVFVFSVNESASYSIVVQVVQHIIDKLLIEEYIKFQVDVCMCIYHSQ